MLGQKYRHSALTENYWVVKNVNVTIFYSTLNTTSYKNLVRKQNQIKI